MASLMIADIYVRLRPCHARHLGAGVSFGAAVCSQGFSLESAASPSMFALCLFFFAVTLLMRYGTWIPNSILASVQLGAAVSSDVPQTGLLPVGSRGRLSSGIPRRRPYSTQVCGRIMLRVVFLATTVSITGRYWLNSGLWLRRLPRPHLDC